MISEQKAFAAMLRRAGVDFRTEWIRPNGTLLLLGDGGPVGGIPGSPTGSAGFEFDGNGQLSRVTLPSSP